MYHFLLPAVTMRAVCFRIYTIRRLSSLWR